MMNKHFTEENIPIVIKHVKRCSTSLIFRKCKTKQQWDFTANLSEWLKLKNISNIEKLDHSYLACGHVRVTAILVNCLVVPYKSEHSTTLTSNNCTHRNLSQKNKKVCLHKKMCMNVYSGFIHNGENLETTQMHFNGWMVKHTGTTIP